jgi:adenylate kinase
MLNIILFGPPGSGKGTQAAKLVEEFGLIHISTGDLLRSEIANNTKLGSAAKSYMDSGGLVPDDVVIGMINEKINKNQESRGVIFDGFPRTVAQAKVLDALLLEYESDINLLLSLEVSEEELKKRLLLRGETSGRTDDQDVSIIENRIREYNEKTAAVGYYYNSQGKHEKVKGEGSIDEIYRALCDAIHSKV